MSNTSKVLKVYGVVEGPIDIFSFPDEFVDATKLGYNWMNVLHGEDDDVIGDYEYFYWNFRDAEAHINHFKLGGDTLELDVQEEVNENNTYD